MKTLLAIFSLTSLTSCGNFRLPSMTFNFQKDGFSAGVTFHEKIYGKQPVRVQK